MNDKANEVLDELVAKTGEKAKSVQSPYEAGIVAGIEMAREVLNDLDFNS